MTFSVRWPDGTVRGYYSPSLVIHDHLSAGERLSVADFRRRSAAALTEAGDRVEARYGFRCSSADDTAARIDTASRAHPEGALVEVVSMHPPLPTATGPRPAAPDPQEHP